jgi:preprotein translocase subunit SecE
MRPGDPASSRRREHYRRWTVGPKGPVVNRSDHPPPTDQVRHVTTTSATKRRSGGVRLFLRQVVAELKKVVRPTRNELLTYTSVVLVFVIAVMTYVSILDFGFGKLVLWAFGGGS